VAAWHEAERWTGLVDGSACPFCAREPRGVLAETETSWVTSAGEVPCRGYVCVIVRRHVVEPFELRPDEAAAFFGEVWRVADAIRDLFRPVKLNYEIHGNTIPHLHVHVFPRYMGDAFEGGPIRAGERHAMHSDADLGAIRSRVGAALA
jgi:diadenosine tetraphosphate (Ap4A) HIT family hydrolase